MIISSRIRNTHTHIDTRGVGESRGGEALLRGARSLSTTQTPTPLDLETLRVVYIISREGFLGSGEHPFQPTPTHPPTPITPEQPEESLSRLLSGGCGARENKRQIPLQALATRTRAADRVFPFTHVKTTRTISCAKKVSVCCLFFFLRIKA